MITIRNERPDDSGAIEQLLDIAFEPSRHGRPSYRLRDGVAKRDDLCFVAEEANHLIGVVRFWPILIGDHSALLLGPIAVHPAHKGQGIGGLLIGAGLAAARTAGFGIVVGVGVVGYLGRFGFQKASPLGLRFPVAVDDAHFLVLELVPGALDGVAGEIQPARGTVGKQPKRRAG